MRPPNSVSMITVAQLLEYARSVCFGALAVSFMLLLVHSYFPSYFPAGVSRGEVFYAGTVLGTLLHRSIHWVLFNQVSRAVGRSLSFYVRFAELNLLHQTGALTDKEFKNSATYLKADYFGLSVEHLTEDGEPARAAGMLLETGELGMSSVTTGGDAPQQQVLSSHEKEEKVGVEDMCKPLPVETNRPKRKHSRRRAEVRVDDEADTKVTGQA